MDHRPEESAVESAAESSALPADSGAASTDMNTFEDGLAELGRIVSGLESGALGLADSITAYERGVALVRRLHEELARTEARVSVLVRIDEEGRPILSPHADATLEPAPARPAKRAGRTKAGRSRPLPGMDEAPDEA